MRLLVISLLAPCVALKFTRGQLIAGGCAAVVTPLALSEAYARTPPSWLGNDHVTKWTYKLPPLQIADATEKSSNAKEDLAATQQQLAADSEFLASLRQQCDALDKESDRQAVSSRPLNRPLRGLQPNLRL